MRRRRHESDDLDIPPLPKHVQRPGAVLARTPRQKGLRFHEGSFQMGRYDTDRRLASGPVAL